MPVRALVKSSVPLAKVSLNKKLTTQPPSIHMLRLTQFPRYVGTAEIFHHLYCRKFCGRPPDYCGGVCDFSNKQATNQPTNQSRSDGARELVRAPASPFCEDFDRQFRLPVLCVQRAPMVVVQCTGIHSSGASAPRCLTHAVVAAAAALPSTTLENSPWLSLAAYVEHEKVTLVG